MWPRHSRWLLLLLPFVPLVAAADDLCIPQVGGLMGLPTLDGIIEGYIPPPGSSDEDFDDGWNNVARVALGEQNGTVATSQFLAGFVPDGGGNPESLFLGYVVDEPIIPGQPTGPATFTPDVLVVIGFSVTTLKSDGSIDEDKTSHWLVHIHPFPTNVPEAGSSLNPEVATFWRVFDDWKVSPIGTPATGKWPLTQVKVSRTAAPFDPNDPPDPPVSGNRWAMEVQIPLTQDAKDENKVYLPKSGTFKFYTNVLDTVGFISPTPSVVIQNPWPVMLQEAGGGTVAVKTPEVNDWGTASLGPRDDCTGVSLTVGNIGVQSPADPDTIVTTIRGYGPITETEENECDMSTGTGTGPNNVFIAKPSNSGPANVGEDVSATFRIANWGMGHHFIPLPTPPPPAGNAGVSDPDDIPASGSKNLTSDWALDYKQSCHYKFHAHQCIQVKLSSDFAGTNFLTDSVERNLIFDIPASKAVRGATIGGEYGALAPDQDAHHLVLFVDTDEQTLPPSQDDDFERISLSSHEASQRPRLFRSPDLRAGMAGSSAQSQFAWLVRGFLVGEDTLIINRRPYRIARNVGEFGYVFGHQGPVERWRWSFTGDGLNQVGTNSYTVDVRPSEEVQVTTTVESVERGGRYRLFLDVGPNFPHGDFGKSFDGRLSVNAGLEGFLTSNTSLEGILGHHAFDSTSGSNPKIWQVSLNAKHYFGPGRFRFFVNGGVGSYHFDPGSTTRVGANVGTGVLYDLSSVWAAEAVYNFHTIDTSGSRTEFSTLQVGIRRSLF